MRNLFLCATAVGLCLSISPASAQQAISTPILTTDENFRDLAGIAASFGGTGFADTTSHNGVMRTGVFYRSEALTGLSNADWTTLSSLRIGLDVDLRTPAEMIGPPSPMAPNAGPDWVPRGAAYTNVNIYGTQAPPATPALTSPPSDAVAYMTSTYQGFVTDPNQRAAFRTALLDLANEPLAALFHCSGGKDRTGWTAAILQTIAGVSPTTIMNDYLATNAYMAGYVNQILGAVPANQRPTLQVLLGVQPEFLQAGLDQVIATYGSMQAYLTQGLGLTQADIYVLRAKMVEYPMLPGQSAFVGNSASGAALLNALQNSPLSGNYTAYNYYLQSAIDAGTLWGVESQVGGQVHADAAAYLLRLPMWLDGAIAPYTTGRDLADGKTRVWLAGVGNYFTSDGRDGIAGSIERSAGPVLGTTYRIDERGVVNAGIGYTWGSVGSAGASAEVDTVLATIGGRYGLSSLETGPYVAARADFGWVNYQSKRPLGGGLGTAQGSTQGAVYGGRADLGDVIRLAFFTVTPQVGVRITQVSLGGFDESGSELALAVQAINHISADLVADLNVGLDPQQLYGWTVVPSAVLGYELIGSPQVESIGSLYGFAVSQVSAYDSHYFLKAGLNVTAKHEAFTVKAALYAVEAEKSRGVDAQLSVGYAF